MDFIDSKIYSYTIYYYNSCILWVSVQIKLGYKTISWANHSWTGGIKYKENISNFNVVHNLHLFRYFHISSSYYLQFWLVIFLVVSNVNEQVTVKNDQV